ncbi:hypothetical protein ACSSZE_12455 [Acidithiobacillus caldus]
MMLHGYFSTLSGQVVLWEVAGVAFWFLSRLADRDSFTFVLLESLVLIAGMSAMLTTPFVLILPGTARFPYWLFALACLSLLLVADALKQFRAFVEEV